MYPMAFTRRLRSTFEIWLRRFLLKERLWKDQLELLRNMEECEKPANIALTAVISIQMELKYLVSHNSHRRIGAYIGNAQESSVASTNRIKCPNPSFSIPVLESSSISLHRSYTNVHLAFQFCLFFSFRLISGTLNRNTNNLQ